jgi:hypothetical protein
MITKQVKVETVVEVTVDDDKFTDAFMKEFQEYITSFVTLDDHILYLGWAFVSGSCTQNDMVEGYGELSAMGIKFNIIDTYTEIV